MAVGCAVFTASQAYALPIETYASNSRLSKGKWVKIKVNEDGMQFVSNETLKSMGFTSPSEVNVYGYGGRRLPQTLNASTVDDLPMQPVVRTDKGLVFYGTGTVNWYLQGVNIQHEQNPYSTGSYYFLSDVEVENPIEQIVLKTAYGTDDERVDTFRQYLLHETEMTAPGETGSDLLGEDFRTTATRSFTFDVPGAVDDKVFYKVRFGSKSGGGATVKYNIGDDQVGQTRFIGNTDVSMHAVLNSLRFEGYQNEPDKSTLTIKYEGSGVIYKANLDYIEAYYNRELSLAQGPLLFMYNVPSKQNIVFSVSGGSDATVVWDVTDPAAPHRVEYDREGAKICFAPVASGLRRYAVFNPSDVSLVPVSAGSVVNQDIHAMQLPQMVIISPKEFITQAERIADLHRSKDGMTVHVLTPEVIYNEFSSGAPDVTAYRKLMKMWYDRSALLPDNEKFGYCLLFGRATYDQRKLSDNLRNSTYPRVLTWQSTASNGEGSAYINETNSYLSDNYIAMLDDTNSFVMSDAILRIGVGRMPVKSVAEARAMTDKLLNYVESPEFGAWKNNVMFLADDGDHAIHAEQSQTMYGNMLRNGGDKFLYERIYIDAYNYGSGSYKKTYPEAKSRMLKMLDEGVAYWQYVGHANPTSLTGEDMWTYTDLTSMTNTRMPLFYTASCEFIRFDADAVSGCETMWLTPKAGIIAAIAANRKVYISSNGNLSSSFGNNIFKRGADGLPRRLGDVYKDALNNAGKDDNKHRFAIMGDPAMRVPMPMYSVSVDTFDGVDVNSITDAAEYPIVNGLSKVKVTGSILNVDGELAADFNGTVVPTLYDAEIVVTTNGHVTDTDSPDGKQISYNDRKNRLFTGTFPVKNGKWEATLLLPEEIENNFTQARLTVYAYSDSGIDAGGATDRFYVYGWNQDAPEDNEDPEILYMYLNSSAFRNGGKVGPNPVFKAKVRDDSGINISSSGIGRLLTVIIDDTKVFDNLADYYVTDPGDPTAGTITYELSGLTAGEHKLDFIVWDNAGNSSRSSFDFVLVSQEEIPSLDIFTDASPAVSSVTFYINSNEAEQGVVDVYDLSGRRVWHAEADRNDGAFSAQWNLRDSGGARVPRGIYLYRATVTNAAGEETKATKKFAVGNP